MAQGAGRPRFLGHIRFPDLQFGVPLTKRKLPSSKFGFGGRALAFQSKNPFLSFAKTVASFLRRQFQTGANERLPLGRDLSGSIWASLVLSRLHKAYFLTLWFPLFGQFFVMASKDKPCTFRPFGEVSQGFPPPKMAGFLFGVQLKKPVEEPPKGVPKTQQAEKNRKALPWSSAACQLGVPAGRASWEPPFGCENERPAGSRRARPHFGGGGGGNSRCLFLHVWPFRDKKNRARRG